LDPSLGGHPMIAPQKPQDAPESTMEGRGQYGYPLGLEEHTEPHRAPRWIAQEEWRGDGHGPAWQIWDGLLTVLVVAGILFLILAA
jgi:hypothetical protein